MSPETLKVVENTVNDQTFASLRWSCDLLLGGYSTGDTVPHEIEMTLRNPTFYHDALNTGEIELPESLSERWKEIAKHASFICGIAGVEPKNHAINSPKVLLELAAASKLPIKTCVELSAYLDDSSELFQDSLPVDFGYDLFLEMLSRNSSRAVGGVTEARNRLRFTRKAQTRIRNRHS